MSSVPTGESASPGYGAALCERFPALSWIAKVDDAIYGVERVVVTMAMLGMSAIVCINVLFQFMARQRAIVVRLGETTSMVDLWPGLVLALSVLVVARGAWKRSPVVGGDAGVVNVLSALTAVGFALFAVALVTLPSRVVMGLLVLSVGLWVALAEFDRPRPLGSAVPDVETKMRVGAAIVVTLVLGIASFVAIPERYSWTTKLALFLLLWTAFIGASMATHDGRHLTIDAVRKALPPHLLPYYQGVSHLLAALFTAVFAYLAALYFVDRMAESAAPGEIPDWLKVLAIPVSLAMVTLRFVGRSVSAFAVGALGLTGAAPVQDPVEAVPTQEAVQ